MECSNYREEYTDYLTGNLAGAEKAAFEKHLSECDSCRMGFEMSERMWKLMGELPVPEPSASMDREFETKMNNYIDTHSVRRSFADRIRDAIGFIPGKPVFQPAFSLILLVIGLMSGYLLRNPGKAVEAQNRQIDSLSVQISEMKEVMLLSLLQDQSASRRIQAVSYTDDMTSLDRKITDALFTTLNEDPNVNVRLATLEALSKLAGNPVVREGLIRSIDLQDSPIMQSAIADLMVKLHEKKSVTALRKLLEKENLNQLVKTNIEKSIQLLI